MEGKREKEEDFVVMYDDSQALSTLDRIVLSNNDKEDDILECNRDG